jgi:hypothetical protein
MNIFDMNADGTIKIGGLPPGRFRVVFFGVPGLNLSYSNRSYYQPMGGLVGTISEDSSVRVKLVRRGTEKSRGSDFYTDAVLKAKREQPLQGVDEDEKN